jgi:hypothetical protein
MAEEKVALGPAAAHITNEALDRREKALAGALRDYNHLVTVIERNFQESLEPVRKEIDVPSDVVLVFTADASKVEVVFTRPEIKPIEEIPVDLPGVGDRGRVPPT